MEFHNYFLSLQHQFFSVCVFHYDTMYHMSPDSTFYGWIAFRNQNLSETGVLWTFCDPHLAFSVCLDYLHVSMFSPPITQQVHIPLGQRQGLGTLPGTPETNIK